jgi:hypothetical protein
MCRVRAESRRRACRRGSVGRLRVLDSGPLARADRLSRHVSPQRLLLVLLVTGAASLLIALARTTPTLAWSLPCFGLACLFVIYVPGRALLVLLGLQTAPIEHLTLALALGIPVSSLAYWSCAYFGVRWAFWLFIAAALSFSAATYHRSQPRPVLARIRYGHALLLAVIFCTWIPFAFSPFHFRDLAPAADGGLSFFAEVDPTFHIAVANELQHQIPPRAPFMPEQALNYHYGGDLLAAMLAVPGVGTAEVTLRYLPLLLMTFSVLACFCLARAWLSSDAGAALAAFLVILGEDGSFVPALLWHQPGLWSASVSQMPTTLSLYMLNPMLPAVGFLMCTLFCLERYFATERRGWLGAAVLAGATLVEYKVFAAAHLLGGLGVTALVYAVRFQRFRPLFACLTLTLASVPLLLAASTTNAGLVVVTLAPWPYVTTALDATALARTPLLELIAAGSSGRAGVLGALAYFGLGLPLYLLIAVGARVVGLRSVVGSLLRPDPARAGAFLIALLVLMGPIATLLFTITIGGYVHGGSGEPNYNNAVWFFVQSKYLMWLFAVTGLWNWAQGRRSKQLVGALLLVSLSVPASIQTFGWLAAAPFTHVPPSTLALLRFMEREAAPGSLCLARDVSPLLLSLTRCRTLEFDLYASSFARREIVRNARRLSRRFWKEWAGLEGAPESEVPDALRETLSALRADYVVVERDLTPSSAALGTGAQILLQRRFENERFVVYRVQRPPNQPHELW